MHLLLGLLLEYPFQGLILHKLDFATWRKIKRESCVMQRDYRGFYSPCHFCVDVKENEGDDATVISAQQTAGKKKKSPVSFI